MQCEALKEAAGGILNEEEDQVRLYPIPFSAIDEQTVLGVARSGWPDETTVV